MSEQVTVKDEIFPRGTNKTYALVELMPRQSPMVDKGPENSVFSFPVLLLWETILFLGVTLAIFVISLLKQAPLEEIANPMLTTDPAKAPWYFVGLQELLEHMHPTLAGVIIPGILVLFLIILPYLDSSRDHPGIWFTSVRGKRIAGWMAFYTLLVMPGYIILDNTLNMREMLRDLVPQWVAQGLIPAAIITLLILLPIIVLRRMKVTQREILIALFTIMLVSAVVLTVSGFLFRGPGFKLYLPWEMPGGYNPWNEF